ncbi:eukaryotic translation initiation factor 4E [Rickenella mellea]|uniref:Eukaryotic translation initiation factor 4E n=1 Tax=Rickenella mellea TaxID=50990 RepID=A0A4Y7Q8U5_9AGAM|nr:eukaryotic translation initiation factor 4E [Rickenella mellea]
MAGYFSNHSQSRFLANSSATTTTSSSNSTSASTTTNPASGGNSTNNNANNNQSPKNSLSRLRVSSSKHFSTSVNTNTSPKEETAGKDKSPGNGVSNGLNPAVHPLRNTWVFWFRQQRAPGNKITNYEEGIKKISQFSSVESFWSLWTHLNPPSALTPTTDYLLFHSAIRRPVWEDPLNITGGKWIIRLKKGVADRLWEDIVLAIVGDQFEDWNAEGSGVPGGGGVGKEDGEDGARAGTNEPQICGCTISVRQSEDILSIWNKEGSDPKVTGQVRDTIRKVLDLPPTTVMEYKTNNDSMQDKSSFRIDRSGTLS